MLNRRVMPGLVNRLGDLIAQVARLLVLGNVFGADHARRITGPRRRNRIVKRILEITFQLNDRLRRKRKRLHVKDPRSSKDSGKSFVDE